jgi:hypothetical protein
MPKERIEFDPIKHEYRVNGIVYPSVTQVLKSVGLGVDYSKVNPSVLEWKRTLGEQLHKAIELDILDDLGGCDPIVKPYLDGWRELRDTLKIKPFAAEEPLFSARYGYCGKPDLLAEYNGNQIGIFDYKSSCQIEIVTVGAQLSGYEVAYREWDNLPDTVKINRFAIKFDKSGRCRLIPLVDPMDKNIFLYAIALCNRKKVCKYV